MNDNTIFDESLTRRRFLLQAGAVSGGVALPKPLLHFAVASARDRNATTELSRDWFIKSIPPRDSLDSTLLDESAKASAASGWSAVAAMPAMIHQILLTEGKITEPWKPGGMEKCFWVAALDWVYATHFAAPPGPQHYLLFQGLKGNVDIYLNGAKIAKYSNINAPLEVPIAGNLRAENSLVLHFQSGTRNTPGTPPPSGHREDLGTYLGPNPALETFGVFDQILLETSDGNHLDEVVAGTSLDESLHTGTLTVDVAGSSHLASVRVHVRLLDAANTVVGESTVEAAVTKGAFESQCTLKVDQPHLWWPRGYGQQPLYRAEVTLIAGGVTQHPVFKTVGFRRITMAQRLHFVVNGVPIFLRGGDFVTENLLTKVWDQPRDETLFSMAENANFNIFRVWAEAPLPHDNFYEMADAHGFLLWQDFSQLPLGPDDNSRALSKKLATQQLKKLKHHPAILCWCGNNEGAQWFHQDYDKDFLDHGPWPGMAAAQDVGAICKQLDPDRYYQVSTPYAEGGLAPNDPRTGDTHGYTNMWFVPGYDYDTFATEDTRIAAPPLRSLEKFIAPEEIWPAGYSTLATNGSHYPYPKTWLPYTTSESWKKVGAVEQFNDATDAASLVYRLGMAESAYFQDTIERQRRGRPATDLSDRRRCGGYISWKFNDSWPQIYSAKVDYFLEPYHAYYALKRAYAPVILSFDIGTFIYLWVINDGTEPVGGTVRIQLYHLDQNVFRREIVQKVTVGPGKSMVAVKLDQSGIAAFRREHILFATLKDDSGAVLARAHAFVELERRLNFPDAVLTMKVEQGVLVISTDKFARAITLEGDAAGDTFGWIFEDNYFDLLPGEIKRVRILGAHGEGRVTAKPWYSSRAATVDWQRAS